MKEFMNLDNIMKIISKNRICWENFIKQCDKLQYGILHEIKLSNGAPVYIKQSEKSIDLTKEK